MSVSMKPGAITLTVTPRLAVSTRERAAIGDQRALGGRIGGVARIALERRHRADGDDAALLGADHAAHERLGDAGERPEVHLHGGFGLVLLHHGGERVVGLAGIVHEAEEALAFDALAEGVQSRLVGQVDFMGRDGAAGIRLHQLGGESLRGIARGAVGEVDVVAGRHQGPHDGGADALSRRLSPEPGS